MALQPLARPAESTQVLRYRGTVVVGQSASTVYPQKSGETPSDAQISGANFIAWVRFPLFEATPLNLTNTAKRLPQNVFDDESPAGEAPHAAVACVASVGPATGINATDLSMDRQTWAQNLEIHFNNIDAKVLLCDAAVSIDNNGANGALVMLDTATSGLGTSTGLPVVAVKFTVLANQGAAQSFDVDIEFEIRHSNHR